MREITIMQWDEQIAEQRKLIEGIKERNELFGDLEDWLTEEEEKLTKLERLKEFDEECEEIALECEEEGYPSHGSNYDLRVEQLMESEYYKVLFG